MEQHESSIVVPAEPEIAQIEQQLEQEMIEIETKIASSETAAWLRELSSFATAMIVTTAGVVLAGAVVILFCYAFYVTAPLAALGIVALMARGARRHRAALAR